MFKQEQPLKKFSVEVPQKAPVTELWGLYPRLSILEQSYLSHDIAAVF